MTKLRSEAEATAHYAMQVAKDMKLPPPREADVVPDDPRGALSRVMMEVANSVARAQAALNRRGALIA